MSEFKRHWVRYLELVAVRQLDVLFALLYVLVVTPTAIVARIAHHPFLPGVRDGSTPGWSARPASAATLDALRRLF